MGWGGGRTARQETDEEQGEAEKTTDCIRPMTVSTRSTRSQPNESGLGGWWVEERGREGERERPCRRRGSARGRSLDVVDEAGASPIWLAPVAFCELLSQLPGSHFTAPPLCSGTGDSSTQAILPISSAAAGAFCGTKVRRSYLFLTINSLGASSGKRESNYRFHVARSGYAPPVAYKGNDILLHSMYTARLRRGLELRMELCCTLKGDHITAASCRGPIRSQMRLPRASTNHPREICIQT